MAFTKVSPAGIGSTPGDGYRIGDSFLHSTGVEITNINATGIVTAASLDISGAIDFDGQTNLDHVSIAGVTTTTDDIIIGADNKKLKLGAGEELQLYQAGNHSIIQHNGSHYLSLRSNAFNVMGAAGTKSIFSGFPDTFSSMYYNGSYKIRTQNTGAEIVGTVVAGGLDISGDIDVDGHTELDNVNIAGIVTVSNTAPGVHFIDTNANSDFMAQVDTGVFKIVDLTNSSATRIVINSAGKLGINEVNPTEMLHIKAEDNTDSFGGIIVYANNNSVYTKHGWRGLDSNETLRFAISGTEKMRLTNGGKLALGRTSADEMMHITHDDNTDHYGGIKIGANNGSVTVKYGWRGIDGSETLRFAIGGTEKLRLDSNGKFLYGIGTARSGFFNTASQFNPHFQIEGAGDADDPGRVTSIIYNSTTTAAPTLLFGKTNTGSVGGTGAVANNHGLGLITFQGMVGGQFTQGATISATVSGSPGDNDLPTLLSFATCADGAASASERLRITPSGRVGINQTDPQAMLQVDYDYANSEVGLRLRTASGSGTKTWQLSEINGNAAVFTIRNATNSYNIFNVDGANQRIGINDTTPERTMDVKGSNCMIQLEGTAGSGRQWSLCSTDNATGTAVDGGPSGSFAIYDDTDGQARLRIDSNGNARFLVSGGSFTAEGTGAYGMSIHNHNSPSMGHLFIYGDNGLIRFRNTSNTYTAQMGYTESSNTMFFANQEGGTTMYITGDGVKLYDNEKFLCGNDNDLGIYHDNSNAYLENTSGSIYFRHSGSNKVEMKSAGGIKFHNQASGNFIQYSNSTVVPNAAVNLQRYGNGYCDMRLSSNYGVSLLLAGASDNTDEFRIQQDNQKNGYVNNEATGKSINLQIGAVTKLQIGDDEESVRVAGTTADHTGTTGGSKGFTIQNGGGYSVPMYFGNETNSAQKSMYLFGYWIYLRGHQNEGVRFVFSQPAGNAIRSDQYQFKYNSALRPGSSQTWDGFSDARAKENVQTITNGIEIIKKLRPVTFDWTNDYADAMGMWAMDKSDPKSYNWVSKKENGYDTDVKNGRYGFIAQEYETVLPKDVKQDKFTLGDTEINDFRTINHDCLIPSLTAALKEAIAKIEVLEAEVAALKGS